MLWLKILIGFLNYTYERVAWLPVCLAANSKLCSKLSKFKQLQYKNNSRIGCRDIQFNIFQFCKVFQVFLAVAITQYGVVLPHDPMIHDPTMQDLSINYQNHFKKNYKHYATRAIFLLSQRPRLLLHASKFPSTSRGI